MLGSSWLFKMIELFFFLILVFGCVFSFISCLVGAVICVICTIVHSRFDILSLSLSLCFLHQVAPVSALKLLRQSVPRSALWKFLHYDAIVHGFRGLASYLGCSFWLMSLRYDADWDSQLRSSMLSTLATRVRTQNVAKCATLSKNELIPNSHARNDNSIVIQKIDRFIFAPAEIKLQSYRNMNIDYKKIERRRWRRHTTKIMKQYFADNVIR